MQILYIAAMIAVFVLCIALLSTARRILRSSPLSSGQLALARPYDFSRPEENRPDRHMQDQEETFSSTEASPIEWETAIDEPLPVSIEAEEEILPAVSAAPAEPVQPAAVPSMPDFAAARTFETPEPRKLFGIRMPRPSRRTYNYALECLLLGVSAWVLIQTQRSNMQQSIPQPSHDRVA